MREYSRTLDALEKQLACQVSDRDHERYDTDWDLEERSGKEAREVYNSPSEAACAEEPSRLSQAQIHHLFEKLAIHRYSLNRRGYPYTYDVNDEQEKVFPDSELLTRTEVEGAWDDWRNSDGKMLFRKYEDRDGFDRQERRGRERLDCREAEGFNDHGEIREDEAGEPRLKPLILEQFEVIFRRLRRKGARLNRWGNPETVDVRDEQLELFSDTYPASSEEIALAFESWDGKWASEHRLCPEAGLENNDADEETEPRQESGKANPRARHRLPAKERTYRIFDELLLNGHDRRSNFTTENLPKLRVINRRLAEIGETKLGDEDALQREWVEYLVVAAKAREEHRRERSPESDSGSMEAKRLTEVEVDLDASVDEVELVGENGHPVAKRRGGRKRKPE